MGANITSDFAMPAPPIKKTVRTSVILPEDAHARIQALADANDVSAAWMIRAAIIRFLEEHSDQAELPLRLPKIRKGAA
ncbi:CopG family transcriptional regulator [Niveispirillum sp.]|uniref:ribbon-helix-helix domain-containing protein n=1 Tax=Niveispirillum sp. TaxID=1917217 RepID=UPI001B671583|nr:CopG family transcriptional regulator [Niveispirillum sp.]MBP7340267.1 CopG family transcriptional regulator [Niveispirillum sp.]